MTGADTAAMTPSRSTASPRPAAPTGVTPFVLGNALLGTIGLFVLHAQAGPLVTTWARCAFGLLALTGWVLLRRQGRALRLRRTNAPAVLAISCLLIAAWGLFFGAIPHTGTGVAVVLFHVQPLWVLLLGAAWLKEAVGRRQVLAVGVAMLGLVLATGVLGADGAARTPGYWAGVAACLVGALCTAGVTLIARRLQDARAAVPPGVLAWWQCAIGTLVLAPWAAAPVAATPGAAWPWLAGLGVLHTGLAYTLLYAGLAHLGAARAAVLQFVYPAVAIALDGVVLGQALSPVQAFGMAVMLGAVTVAERRAL